MTLFKSTSLVLIATFASLAYAQTPSATVSTEFIGSVTMRKPLARVVT